jgi:hypothetical protein
MIFFPLGFKPKIETRHFQITKLQRKLANRECICKLHMALGVNWIEMFLYESGFGKELHDT